MPAESINVLCIVLGVLITLNGLIKLIEYFKNRTFSILLYIALIYLVLGIAVAILAPIIIESAIFIILIGVFFIIKGIAEKYEGTADFSYKEGEFTARVMLALA